MNLSISPDLEAQIDVELRSGRFNNAGEFLSAAVQHYLIAREMGEVYSRADVEEKLTRGLAQIERGETVDGEEFMQQLRRRTREARRTRP